MCAEPPPLHSPDSRFIHPESTHILFIKFPDGKTVDETIYRSEVSLLATCKDNKVQLNVEKTKEIVVDFMRKHGQHFPLTINGAAVEWESRAPPTVALLCVETEKSESLNPHYVLYS